MLTLNELLWGLFLALFILALCLEDLSTFRDELRAETDTQNNEKIKANSVSAVSQNVRVHTQSSDVFSFEKKTSPIPKGKKPLVDLKPIPDSKLEYEIDPSRKTHDPQIMTQNQFRP